jgi:hypothetical protein
VSAASATLIAGGLAILGTLLGVVIERLMRLIGRLRFEASVLWLVLTDVIDEDGYPRNVSWRDADEKTEASGVRYTFAMDLFNGKEAPTGLRDPLVVLVRDDGERFEGRTLEVGPPESRMQDVINLLPRQFKHS